MKSYGYSERTVENDLTMLKRLGRIEASIVNREAHYYLLDRMHQPDKPPQDSQTQGIADVAEVNKKPVVATQKCPQDIRKDEFIKVINSPDLPPHLQYYTRPEVIDRYENEISKN